MNTKVDPKELKCYRSIVKIIRRLLVVSELNTLLPLEPVGTKASGEISLNIVETK